MITISIVSGKGGVGKTTIAINLAYALSKLNKKVCLVDLNLTTPHINTMLSFSYDSTITDYLKGRVEDIEVIYPYFNFWIAPASLKLESLENVTPEITLNIKRDLGHFDYLIIDSAPGFGKEGIMSILLADKLLFVMNPTYSSLVDVLKANEIAKKLNKEVIGVVINKKRLGSINEKDVEEVTGLKVISSIKFDKAFLEAETKKLPAAHINKNVLREFEKISKYIIGLPVEEENKGIIRKIFSFLNSK